MTINKLYVEKLYDYDINKLTTKDCDCAWGVYVQLNTRVTCEQFTSSQDSEKRALDSIYTVMDFIRRWVTDFGVYCYEFSKVAFTISNEVIRPFLSKWHNKELDEEYIGNIKLFKQDIDALREVLIVCRDVCLSIAKRRDESFIK